jgi:hypothetical protein
MTKRLILGAIIALALVSGSKANAVRCYWDTQFAFGWDGAGWYAGSACYTDDGLQMLSFSPRIPVLTF